MSSFDTLSKDQDSHEIILASDVVIGMTSTILIYSYVMKKKTISVVPRPLEKDWLSLCRDNLILCLSRRNKLYEMWEKIACKDMTYFPSDDNIISEFNFEKVEAFIEHLGR